jgi:putative ABC transport system substrate-binding protein
LETGRVVARVLKGEKPGDIPVSFATGTDLVVNTAAAAKYGVTIPDSVLSKAKNVGQ